jgi:hypothetical protein
MESFVIRHKQGGFCGIARRTVIPAACKTDGQNFKENKRNKIKIKNHLLWKL